MRLTPFRHGLHRNAPPLLGAGTTRPVRRLSAGALVTSIGDGIWYSTWAIYLTHSVGLPAEQVGAGLTIAGLFGFLAATPIGHQADRRGPRRILVCLALAQGVGMALYVLVTGFWAFLAVAIVVTTAKAAAGGVQTALVAGIASGEERLPALASLRAVSHVGWAVGALLGALALQLDSRPFYQAMILANAASFFGYAAVVRRVPRISGVPRSADPPLPVVRDRPYLLLAVLLGVLALCWGLLSSGVPLWITHHTAAPYWVAAVILGTNSLLVALFQRRVSLLARGRRGAPGAAVVSGCTLAGACLVFSLSHHRGGFAAIALLLGAGLILVVGELFFVAAQWGLSVALMPEDAKGQYQGMIATGVAAAQTAAPVLMTTLVVSWGFPGWFVLAALFAAAGGGLVPVARWAWRTRAGLPKSRTEQA
jgi:MFS family permease